jgi:arsenical pump membrane protein
LLWRRVLHVEDHSVQLGEFVRLGARTVPAGIAAATVLLWFSAQVLT